MKNLTYNDLVGTWQGKTINMQDNKPEELYELDLNPGQYTLTNKTAMTKNTGKADYKYEPEGNEGILILDGKEHRVIMHPEKNELDVYLNDRPTVFKR